MFINKSNRPKSKLDLEIERLLRYMADEYPGSEDYATISAQLQKLYDLKAIDAKKSVSPDTMAMITANLAGILMIVGHERANVLTSKAIGFVTKLR